MAVLIVIASSWRRAGSCRLSRRAAVGNGAGSFGNVEPLRLKDRAYLDVVAESSTIRSGSGSVGGALLPATYYPPLSIVLACVLGAL
jgi:hypothetical protein